MLIKKPEDLRYSEITPRPVYLNRRRFLAGLPVALAGGRELLSPIRARAAGGRFANLVKSPFSTTEKQNSLNDGLEGFGGRGRGQAAQVRLG
jgi:sulfoxide reductase catalytic subunit YedY